MLDPISEVFRKAEMLETALTENKKRGEALAEAERVYRVALSAKILELREAGYPTTLIGDLARGDREVAKLKFDRDCAEVVYESSQEAINVYKKVIDVLREQIDREWRSA